MATLDVVTLDEAKARLGGNVARTTDDASFEADITALSALFDDRYGAIVQRAIADEEVRPNRCREDLADYWPVHTTPAPTADTGTVEIIDRGFGALRFSTCEAATVSYTAGRFDDTDSVSEQFKAAFIIALRNWRQAEHVAPFTPPGPDYPTPRQAFPTFAVPRACDQMLAKYRRFEGIA